MPCALVLSTMAYDNRELGVRSGARPAVEAPRPHPSAWSGGLIGSEMLSLPQHTDTARHALCAVGVRWAASGVGFSIKEVDVGLAADVGTLALLPARTHRCCSSSRSRGARLAPRRPGARLGSYRASCLSPARRYLGCARVCRRGGGEEPCGCYGHQAVLSRTRLIIQAWLFFSLGRGCGMGYRLYRWQMPGRLSAGRLGALFFVERPPCYLAYPHPLPLIVAADM